MGNITKSQIISVAEEWRQVKSHIAELEAVKRELEGDLKCYLSQHRLTEVEGVKLVEIQASYVPDTAKLKSEYADIWEQVKKLKQGYSYLKG